MKLKLEAVKEWFTPIQACHYLFEDVEKYDEENLLKELAILVNKFKLTASVKSYNLKPRYSESGNNKAYEAMISVFNAQNSIPLPLMLNFIVPEWLKQIVVENVEHPFIALDIYDFDKQYEENNCEIDLFLGYEQRLQSDRVSKGYHVLLTSFEIGFMRTDLDKFITDITTKPQKNAELDPRERETMIRIIHALASNVYKYPQHGSLTEILNDFQINNNGVCEKTLRKYLKEFDTLQPL